ncbi:MAG: 50S ribosomal protein L23 [Bacteroidia bacterium]
MKIATEIIIKPIITEKYLQAAEKLGQYAFVVDKKANKYQIKNAIEKLYNVKVESVNTQQYVGKVKMRNTTKGLAIGRVNRNKKAIITLKDGYSIDIYANI